MRVIVIVIALLVSIAGVAHAQTTTSTSSDVRLANDLYKAGHEKVKAGDWEGARESFARAYALYPQPVILANLAGAEVQTGHLVQATEHYRQFLKNTSGLDPSEVEIAKKAMANVEARLAHVRITVANTRSSDAIELDGRALPSAALDADYPVDPGKHVIRIVRNGAEEARSELTLAEGETRPVRLVARAITSSPSSSSSTTPANGEEKKSSSIFSSPLFWVATGVVVIGAATAICLGAVCRSDEPYQGNLGNVKLP